MIQIATSIFSLLLATAALLLGIGLQGTLLGLRADVEQYSMTVTGIIMSSYFAGFAIGSFYCSPLIRQFGHIRAYAAFAALASTAAIGYALSVEPWFWVVLRMITGFCVVGLYMAIESWLNVLANNAMRGRFFGIYMIITLLAMAGGQHLLRFGEVTSFELFAISSILISLSLIPLVMTRIAQPSISAPHHLSLKQLYRVSPLGVVGTVLTGMITSSFWGMGALYATQIGLDNVGVAWLMSAIIIGGATLQWPLGLLSDLINRRVIISLCGFAGAAMAILNTYVNIESIWLFYAVSFLFGGFAFTLYGLCVAHANDRIDPEHSLEAAQGLLQLYGFGAIFGPFLASQAIAHFGPKGLMIYFSGIMASLGLFTLHRMHNRAAPPSAEQHDFVPLSRTSPAALEMSPFIDETAQHPNEEVKTEADSRYT